jgi:hypothetical protein
MFSYGSADFSLIDLNQSLLHKKKFRNFLFSLFFGFILIDEAEIEIGHTSLTCMSPGIYFSEIVQIF